MLRASKRSRLREDESAMSSFAPGELDFVDIELAPPSLAMERRDNGEIILRSTIPLADHARHVGEHPGPEPVAVEEAAQRFVHGRPDRSWGALSTCAPDGLESAWPRSVPRGPADGRSGRGG